MADKTFKEGDVVILKSGGPSMTIYKIEDQTAKCSWFDSKQQLQYSDFSIVTLTEDNQSFGIY